MPIQTSAPTATNPVQQQSSSKNEADYHTVHKDLEDKKKNSKDSYLNQHIWAALKELEKRRKEIKKEGIINLALNSNYPLVAKLILKSIKDTLTVDSKTIDVVEKGINKADNKMIEDKEKKDAHDKNRIAAEAKKENEVKNAEKPAATAATPTANTENNNNPETENRGPKPPNSRR